MIKYPNGIVIYVLVLFELAFQIGAIPMTTSSIGKCPDTKGLMKRVGETRYFIFQNTRGKSDKYYDWEGAKKMCSELKDFKMATVEKLTTFVVLGRELEKLVTKHTFVDTWYWLDAKYNKEKQIYMWGGDVSRPLKFTNFFYRYPRPTGLAGFIDKYKTYQINKTTEQCLTLALPFPAAYNMKPPEKRGGMIYGFQTSFDEKPCSAKQTIHAICESTLPECTSTENDPFSISEDKSSYFEDGNWLLANQYLINWRQVTKAESEKYCEKFKMFLFSPAKNEAGLIPLLKMSYRGITFSQFWTNWTYKVDKPGNGMVGKFLDPDGNEKATIRAFVNASGIDAFETDSRSTKFDTSLCVAMQLSSEFKKSQYPCPNGHESACNWNFIQLVPANCNNFQATICDLQGKQGGAKWKKKWTLNPVEWLNDTNQMLTVLATPSNRNTYRSGIKQTFGSLFCPEGFRMPRITDKKWHSSRIIPDGYNELLESFWVVDEEEFRKYLNSTCALSTPDGDGSKRIIKMVPCTEWHFYLCDRIYWPIKHREFKLSYTIPTSIRWDDRRHERKYPIVD